MTELTPQGDYDFDPLWGQCEACGARRVEVAAPEGRSFMRCVVDEHHPIAVSPVLRGIIGGFPPVEATPTERLSHALRELGEQLLDPFYRLSLWLNDRLSGRR